MYNKFELRKDVFVGCEPGEFGKIENIKEKILRLIYKEFSNLWDTSSLEWTEDPVQKRKWWTGNFLFGKWHNFEVINTDIAFPDGEPRICIRNEYNVATITCGDFSCALSINETKALIEQAKRWMKLCKKEADKKVEEKIDLRLSKHDI